MLNAIPLCGWCITENFSSRAYYFTFYITLYNNLLFWVVTIYNNCNIIRRRIKCTNDFMQVAPGLQSDTVNT